MGCIKADHACEFVNRVTPIIVPNNASHSSPGTIGSPGYGANRPWTPTYGTSPRTHGAHRRSTPGYHPYASPTQPSPTGGTGTYSPGFMMGPWMQQQPSPGDVMENYSGTGYHHLVDPTSVSGRGGRNMGMESPGMMGQSTLAQRRLQREGSYTYGAETQGTSPLPSPLMISAGIPSSRGYSSSPSLLPRDESPYGKMMYAPLSGNPQLSGSIPSPNSLSQSQSAAAHILQQKPGNYSPLSSASPHSQSSQPYHQTPSGSQPPTPYSDQPRLQQYQDPMQSSRQQYSSQQDHSQYSSEFAIPSNPRRPTAADISAHSTSSSIFTTQTQQSSHSSQSHDYSPSNLLPEYSYSRSSSATDRYPGVPYKLATVDARPISRPSSRTDASNLTPQSLADHTHVQESIHEQHVDAPKSIIPAMDNRKDLQVIEYLNELPTPSQETAPPSQQHRVDDCNA